MRADAVRPYVTKICVPLDSAPRNDESDYSTDAHN